MDFSKQTSFKRLASPCPYFLPGYYKTGLPVTAGFMTRFGKQITREQANFRAKCMSKADDLLKPLKPMGLLNLS